MLHHQSRCPTRSEQSMFTLTTNNRNHVPNKGRPVWSKFKARPSWSARWPSEKLKMRLKVSIQRWAFVFCWTTSDLCFLQTLHSDEQVPLPLPPGGELAAIWSANLGQPIGSVKKFDDTLARSYTQITNQDLSVSVRLIKVKLPISIQAWLIRQSTSEFAWSAKFKNIRGGW